jgi:eukaryotic-like serine/threonine-protein kinase
MHATLTTPRCPVCDGALRSGETAEWCPACAWRDLAGEEETNAAPVEAGMLFEVDRHDVIEEIARGGGGIVYRARQREPRRDVALKILPPHQIDSPEMRARFRAEATTIAALDHPAILPIYAVGEYRDMPYFTMKLASGGSLASRCVEFRGRWRAIAEVVATLADAVQFAHAHGVIHRDLKPGNVLFDEAGRSYVSDFGTAKFAHADAAATRTTATLGTPAYLAPEVAERGAGAATIASDVYGLGTILYELLAGGPPFTACALPALVRDVIERPPVEPSKRMPGVPRDLDIICVRCLAKSPGQRFPSAAALARDLRCWLAGRLIESRTATAFERTTAWARRNPSTALAGAFAALTLLTAATVLQQQNTHLRKALGRATSAERGAREQLHVSLVNEARLLRRNARAGERAAALATLERAAAIQSSPELRTELVATLARPDVLVQRVLPVTLPARNATLAFTADLSSHLVSDPAGGFVQRDTGSGGVRRRFHSGRKEPTLYLRFGYGDRAIVASYLDRSSEVWDVGGESPWWTMEGADVPVVTHGGFGRNDPIIALHPNGEGLSYVAQDRSVRWVARATGAERVVLSSAEDTFELSYSPNGDTLLVVRASLCAAYAWPAGDRLWQREGRYSPCSAGWRRDGRLVAIGLEGRNDVLLCDAATGRAEELLSGHSMHPRMLQFDRDGNRLLSVAWDGTLIGWNAKTGSVEFTRTAYPSALTVAADGRRVAFSPSAGEIAVATMDDGAFFREFADAENTQRIACDLGVSADGQWAISTDHFSVRLWSVASARLVWQETTTPAPWTSAMFASDGLSVLHSGANTGIFRRALVTDAATGRPGLGPAEPIGAARPGLLRLVDRDTHDWWVEEPEPWQIARWPNGVAAKSAPMSAIKSWARASVSPDRRYIATADDEHHVVVFRSDTGERVAALPLRGRAAVGFSPDGRWLLTGTREEYRLWRVETWQPGPTWPAVVDNHASGNFCFSPDGSLLALRHGGGALELRETKTYAPLLRLEPPAALRSERIEWSPDGSAVFLLCTGHRLVRWDLAAIWAEMKRRGVE